jgi:hypothetical protein
MRNFLKYCILLCFTQSFAQEPKDKWSYNKQMALGANFLLSTFETHLPLPQGNQVIYKPIIMQAYFYFPIIKQNTRHQLAFYIEPAVFPVILKPSSSGLNIISDYTVAFEGGFNGGFVYNVLLAENLAFFTGVGSGPYYFSTENSRQYKGYLFSDNVIFGFKTRFGSSAKKIKDMEMVFHIRYRHISNARFFLPNGGIDNIFMGIGFSKLIQANYLFKNKNKQNESSNERR